MAITILYCAQCDQILAAAPGLDLAAKCVSHVADGGVHSGYVALRLLSAQVSSAEFADLTALAAAYPKADYTAKLEALAGRCP